MTWLSRITLISISIAFLMGCSGNQKNSGSQDSSAQQEAGTTNAQSNTDAASHSENQTGQATPGAGPVMNVDKIFEDALNGNLGEIEKAIEGGFDVQSTDSDMHTVLMMASYNGHSRIVQLLLDQGASVDHRDIMDRTALMYASTGPFNETVSLLLKAGADPNLVDNEEHFTALMFAAAEGQPEVVRTLLEHGADKTMLDVDGESAYDFALTNGHAEVAKILK